ncbi:ATP phosphoribosyltransferase regulatory subunit, partial [Pseudomonas sp. A-1]
GQARAQLAAAPAAVLAALAELEAVADELAAHYPALPLYFDLGELRGYHYHTGMVFAAFVPGVGQAIAQGGRYDDIGADFGRARPATGFSTDLKTLVSLGQAIQAEAPGGVWAPQGGEAGLWQAVLELRRSGRRVVQALPGQSLVDARAAGCDSELRLQEGGWQVSPLAS